MSFFFGPPSLRSQFEMKKKIMTTGVTQDSIFKFQNQDTWNPKNAPNYPALLVQTRRFFSFLMGVKNMQAQTPIHNRGL